MKTTMKTAVAVAAIALLAGCEADGGFPGGGGGGGGGGEGGLQPGTDITNFIPTARGGGTATGITDGALCALGCAADTPEFVVDGDATTLGVLSLPVSVAGDGTVGYLVDMGRTINPGGNTVAAFELNNVASLLGLGVLPSLIVNTYAGGDTSTVIESFDASELAGGSLGFQALETGTFLAGGVPEMPYDTLELLVSSTLLAADVGSLAGTNSTFEVLDVVTEAMPPP